MNRFFTPELFRFLRALKSHNDRDWFLKNKERYENEVKQPMLRFIADFAPRLRGISRNFVADPKPVGGSMFRIYRDVRFSEDKSPYKTHVAAHFPHRRAWDSGESVHAPGFYIHLEPGECFVGGGLWRPDSVATARVRNTILDHPDKWKKIRRSGLEIEGESLKRPPHGFDSEHPFIEDLKRKDYVTSITFTERQACAPDFLDRITKGCTKTGVLVEFLCDALGMGW